MAALAHRTGRSRSFYIKEAILDHLENLEDTYLGEQAMEAFRRSDEEAIPLEELEWPD